MKKGYLANGLFTIGDRAVNQTIKNKLQSIAILGSLELYVPQDNNAINDKTNYADSKTIAKADMKELMESDFLIAVIDGVEIDSGVAAEIGAFSTTGKPIYALYSDIRLQGTTNLSKTNALINDATENQFVYRNLFVIGLIKRNAEVLHTVKDLCETVVRKELL